ncbi:PEGA domain-containing protein [Gracilimonas sp.]|uniref:PEGA domain-containing protein n=1 Tax=Gracilimonas sp. TaxID=1974203 RepID=UPI0032ECE327
MNSSCQVHRSFLVLIFMFLLCSENLRAQQPISLSAWVKVVADLDEYYVVIDKDFENAHLVNRGDSLQVEPGVRHITVVWKTIHDQSFTTRAKTGKTNEIRVYHTFPSYPRSSHETIARQTNLFIATDENSDVYINGEYSGKHLVKTLLNPGTHQLRIEHPDFGVLEKRVEVNSQNITKVARFNENPSTLPFAMKLLPGAEYIASRRYKRATITYLGLGLLTANLIRQDMAYSKKLSKYNELEVLYQNAQTSEEAIIHRRNALSAKNKLDQISNNFNLTLLISGGLYLISTLDAFRKPKSGYRHPSNFFGADMTLTTSSVASKTSALLSLKIELD